MRDPRGGGSRILDLGCGDGTLLAHLRDAHNVTGYGIEIDIDNITTCVQKGLNVIQTDLDAGLSDFDADSFDYVVMTETIQAVRHPDRILQEMLRIGREGIITFPNFGHWRQHPPRHAGRLRGSVPRTAHPDP